MALVNLKQMLNDARDKKYAVAAFDVSNHDMALAVIQAAEEMKSPVILMGLNADLEGDKLEYWINGLRPMAERALVPVCIHLDHAADFEFIKRCIDIGFSSVMIDGSVLSLEENIRVTKQVVEYAHARNVTVEAELGHVGDGIVGNSETKDVKDKEGIYDNPDDTLTNPEEMVYFIENTGVDCLAVAVGTAHGVYVHEPKLHFDRLEELNRLSTVPMVLHGGSGTPDDQVRKAVAGGICKMNVFSELLIAYYSAMKEQLNETDNMSIWPITANKKPLEALKEVVRKKIILLGSDGKA